MSKELEKQRFSIKRMLFLFVMLMAVCSCILLAEQLPVTPTMEEIALMAAPPPPPAFAVIDLTFAGDCTLAAYNGADEELIRFPKVYENAGSLTYPFDNVKHLFAQDDLTFINFEGALTTAETAANKRYFFKGPPAYAAILPASSIEAATLANNHARDYLEQGFNDTIAHLQNAGVGVAYEDTPFITEIHGTPVIFIGENTAFTEGITEDEAAARVTRQIVRHKRLDTIVIVNIHWGVELAVKPAGWQTNAARAWIDAGADLVVGHHPHILQGIETYKGRHIVYSLGNFAFGGDSLALRKETMLLHASFAMTEGIPALAEISVTPCHTTSSTVRNRNGTLRNNYRPAIVTGEEAQAVKALLLSRSALLENGVTQLSIES